MSVRFPKAARVDRHNGGVEILRDVIVLVGAAIGALLGLDVVVVLAQFLTRLIVAGPPAEGPKPATLDASP